jgi:serine/threonine protein kinase
MIIGDYAIDRVLGRGSAGTVHHARRQSDLLEVAIKRLPQLAGPEEQARILAESQALSRLHHPNILALIDVIETDLELAVVTEYVEGGTLAQLLEREGPLEPNHMVALLSPIADALHHAHQAGILHRDVKPSNILLRANGTPVLADFGLAFDDVRTSQTTRTALGSAAYLDPDVLDGRRPTTGSDAYALGIVAYECLTGRLPFAGDTTFAVLRTADRGTFEPLDRTAVGSLADQVERAFTRASSDRFATLDDLSRAWRHPDQAAPFERSESIIQRVEHRDPGATETSAFRLPSRPVALRDAVPVTPTKPWKKIGVFAAGAVAAASLAVGIIVTHRSSSVSGPGGLVANRPTCDASIVSQCVDTFQRNPDGIRVSFAGDDAPTQYRVGERSDGLRVGNFFCGSVETLAVYRPSTGTLYYFKDWPLPSETTDAAADLTGVLNANPGVGDINNDGCADVALDVDGVRTWFTPATQAGRLEAVPQVLQNQG